MRWWMSTKHIVVIISQYLQIKPSCCTPWTYTVIHVNNFSIKLGEKAKICQTLHNSVCFVNNKRIEYVMASVQDRLTNTSHLHHRKSSQQKENTQNPWALLPKSMLKQVMTRVSSVTILSLCYWMPKFPLILRCCSSLQQPANKIPQTGQLNTNLFLTLEVQYKGAGKFGFS